MWICYVKNRANHVWAAASCWEHCLRCHHDQQLLLQHSNYPFTEPHLHARNCGYMPHVHYLSTLQHINEVGISSLPSQLKKVRKENLDSRSSQTLYSHHKETDLQEAMLNIKTSVWSVKWHFSSNLGMFFWLGKAQVISHMQLQATMVDNKTTPTQIFSCLLSFSNLGFIMIST